MTLVSKEGDIIVGIWIGPLGHDFALSLNY